MTATLVLPGTASEAEWLAARRQGITASEISVVMGLSPYSSPFALYHQKTGDLPGQDDNLAMALGRHLESFVADQFAALHPEFWLDAQSKWSLYAHPDRPWQMATPDRLVDCCPDGDRIGPPLAVLECKTSAGYDGWGDDGTDEIPVHYRCQVLQQMDVLGVGTGFVACLFLHSRQLRVYELTMDDAAEFDLKLMRTEAVSFLARIERHDPPDVDWRHATRDALKRLHPSVEDRDTAIPHQLATWYRSACARVKEAERRKHLYENRIRALMGNARRAMDRDDVWVPVARRDVFDLAEKTITRKACTVDRLVPVTPKEHTP